MSIPYEDGPAQVRQALDEAFERQNALAKGMSGLDQNSSFCSNPQEYMWKYLGKKEMLVPYNCEGGSCSLSDEHLQFPRSGSIRWEMHPVWIVEGELRRGESNLLALRRFYIDEENWLILLGEGYDQAGKMINCYVLHEHNVAERSQRGRWYPA
jgi:hypothetical protein